MKRKPCWMLYFLLALLMLGVRGASASEFAYPPYPSEHERFGVCGWPLGGYKLDDLEALGAGWYVHWWAISSPPHPNGMAALQIIRLNGSAPTLDWATLETIIRANPGAVWRIGNEPDSKFMDNCTPEQYARGYHDVYHFVKAVDPTAKAAFGGLVQATPLRLLYLDFVWQKYQELYGEAMPVDVWTLHSFILPETPIPPGWGAEIPPGMEAYAHRGMQYAMRDHDNMEIFRQRFIAFRQWMADHGQRDKPLIVPEYGILLWPEMLDEDGNDFDDDRVIQFMYATFDFFRTATDSTLGYPADGNRLVQAWAWYSLDDDTYYNGQQIGEGYGGDLFTGPYTKSMTALGQAYAAYVHPLVGPPYTDLYPQRLLIDATGYLRGETGAITLTVEAANHGRLAAQNVAAQFWQGEPGAGGVPIGAPQIIPRTPGRYEGVGVARVAWTPATSGTYTLWVELDPANAIVETSEGNNRLSATATITAEPPSIDLYPLRLLTEPAAPIFGRTRAVTLTAEVANGGRQPAQNVEVRFWELEPGATLIAGTPVTVTRVPARDAGVGRASVAWSPRASGVYTLWVEVDSAHTVTETDETNNLLSAIVRVWERGVYLPAVMRNG